MAFGDIIQSLEYNDKVTSLTLDWTDGSTPTEGNLIICVAGTRGNATFSTPSGYTEAQADDPWTGSSSTNTYIWYKIAGASESNVTVTAGSVSGSMYIGAVEVEGPWAASILEHAEALREALPRAPVWPLAQLAHYHKLTALPWRYSSIAVPVPQHRHLLPLPQAASQSKAFLQTAWQPSAYPAVISTKLQAQQQR